MEMKKKMEMKTKIEKRGGAVSCPQAPVIVVSYLHSYDQVQIHKRLP
jgi:hypothetical protein